MRFLKQCAFIFKLITVMADGQIEFRVIIFPIIYVIVIALFTYLFQKIPELDVYFYKRFYRVFLILKLRLLYFI